MELNVGEHGIYEFYLKNPNAETCPLRVGATSDNVMQSLLQHGYGVSRPRREDYPAIYEANHIFQDGSELSPDRVPDKIFLISKMEQLRALLRYRCHQNRDSIKIEGDDPEIKVVLLPLLDTTS